MVLWSALMRWTRASPGPSAFGYTLVNIGASYEIGNWNFAGMINNVTDEEYFRANFPNLFGSVVVLPELPRNFSLRAAYRF